jgi:hypothetical protein
MTVTDWKTLQLYFDTQTLSVFQKNSNKGINIFKTNWWQITDVRYQNLLLTIPVMIQLFVLAIKITFLNSSTVS